MKCIVRNISATVSHKPPFEINGISFALKEGQILAVLGQSGAGKTSLLNALAGFLPVNHGAVILDDKTVSCASFCLPPLERNMGIIFQDHNLLPHLSLMENMTLGMEKNEHIQRKKEIQAMLKDLQLTHLQQMLPHQVSGGQQQRVALGRAILHDKKLLLFDEPFSGLDRARMMQLAQTIRESVKKYKRIAVLVTHHIEEAFSIADMVGIMRNGELLEVSTPEKIYHTPSNLEIAAYVGPVNTLVGTRSDTNHVKTLFGEVETVNDLPKTVTNVQLLTRPDDYSLELGGEYDVENILFLGMSQIATVVKNNEQMYVSLEHHKILKKGDKVSLVLKNEHPYMAYDMDGIRVQL